MSSDKYYIVFKEAERKYWWMKLLKKNFSHCFLLMPDGSNWIKCESGHGITRIDSYNDYAELIDNSIIVPIEAKQRKKWLLINTCVGMVKLITGLGGGALTPYQLYKKVK